MAKPKGSGFLPLYISHGAWSTSRIPRVHVTPEFMCNKPWPLYKTIVLWSWSIYLSPALLENPERGKGYPFIQFTPNSVYFSGCISEVPRSSGILTRQLKPPKTLIIRQHLYSPKQGRVVLHILFISTPIIRMPSVPNYFSATAMTLWELLLSLLGSHQLGHCPSNDSAVLSRHMAYFLYWCPSEWHHGV